MAREDATTKRSLVRPLLLGFFLALLYPVSLGPVCWTMSRLRWEHRHPNVALAVHKLYLPLFPTIVHGPKPVRRTGMWWIGLGMSAPTQFHDDWPDGIGWSNPGYTYTLCHY